MKTLRYRIGKEVKPGILDQDGKIRDASSLVKDWDNKNVTIDKLNEVKLVDLGSLPLVDNHDGIAPCVCKESIGKIICIGLNYSDHAEETGQKVPPEPIIFAKATSAVIGPNDDVEIPKKSVKSDWEVELYFPIRFYRFFWNFYIIIWTNNSTCCFCKNNWFRRNFLSCFFCMIRIIQSNTNNFTNAFFTNTRCNTIMIVY